MIGDVVDEQLRMRKKFVTAEGEFGRMHEWSDWHDVPAGIYQTLSLAAQQRPREGG